MALLQPRPLRADYVEHERVPQGGRQRSSTASTSGRIFVHHFRHVRIGPRSWRLGGAIDLRFTAGPRTAASASRSISSAGEVLLEVSSERVRESAHRRRTGAAKRV